MPSIFVKLLQLEKNNKDKYAIVLYEYSRQFIQTILEVTICFEVETALIII